MNDPVRDVLLLFLAKDFLLSTCFSHIFIFVFRALPLYLALTKL
jgi:hypothetical protein